jgi:hypothetical protein
MPTTTTTTTTMITTTILATIILMMTIMSVVDAHGSATHGPCDEHDFADFLTCNGTVQVDYDAALGRLQTGNSTAVREFWCTTMPALMARDVACIRTCQAVNGYDSGKQSVQGFCDATAFTTQSASRGCAYNCSAALQQSSGAAAPPVALAAALVVLIMAQCLIMPW